MNRSPPRASRPGIRPSAGIDHRYPTWRAETLSGRTKCGGTCPGDGCGLPEATGALHNPQVERRDYGRAHTLVDGAGILIKQAARVLLGRPAASRAAERAMVAQALAEPDADRMERAKATAPQQSADDVWTRGAEQFRQRFPHRWN